MEENEETQKPKYFIKYVNILKDWKQLDPRYFKIYVILILVAIVLMIFLVTNICVMIEQDQEIAILSEQIDFQVNAIQMSSVLLAKIFGKIFYHF